MPDSSKTLPASLPSPVLSVLSRYSHCVDDVTSWEELLCIRINVVELPASWRRVRPTRPAL